MISAKIIADSKNKFGDRITTFICTFPRIILAEINTHRVFSRNSASSRAIPFAKMVKMVEENPFIPIKWMKDHSGMQGNEYFDENDQFNNGVRLKPMPQALLDNWLAARDNAVLVAKSLAEKGLTKQIVNRLLEPFMWHTAIITATEYENFFALRNHEAAEIHLQELARLMMFAYNDSSPKLLEEWCWHIPFGDVFDTTRIFELMGTTSYVDAHRGDYKYFEMESVKTMIATARCARLSYHNFEGKDDYEADVKLYNQLSKMGHFSPFEHCAKAMNDEEYQTISGTQFNHYGGLGWCGNFKGFIQLRKNFENENRSDSRVVKK